MSLLDFAVAFGAGAADSLAESTAARHRSKLEEQRQANLARLKAQHKREEAIALEERRRQAVYDPIELFALTGDFRALASQTETLGTLTNFLDPTTNKIITLDEKNPEHRERIEREGLLKTSVVQREGGVDYFQQGGRQYKRDRITGETWQFFHGQWIPADPEGARAAVEKPEPEQTFITETLGEPRLRDFDVVGAGPGPVNRTIAAIARTPVLGQIAYSLNPEFAGDERSARIILENLYSQIRNAAARIVQEGGRLSDMVLLLTEKQIPNNGIFSTDVALDADLNELFNVLFAQYQAEYRVMHDPGVNPARNIEAENYVTNMRPALQNLEGIILTRQFAQTTAPLVNAETGRVENRAVSQYSNSELIRILNDDEQELSRNQMFTIQRLLYLRGIN